MWYALLSLRQGIENAADGTANRSERPTKAAVPVKERSLGLRLPARTSIKVLLSLGWGSRLVKRNPIRVAMLVGKLSGR